MPIHGSWEVTASREGGMCAGQSRLLPVLCIVLCFLLVYNSGNCTVSLWRTVRIFKKSLVMSSYIIIAQTRCEGFDLECGFISQLSILEIETDIWRN